MHPEILVLSLDHVVIDGSESVVPAIRQTVQGYFSRFLGIRGSGSLVSAEEVTAFLLAGGLESPWEVSATMIRYLLSLLPAKHQRSRPARDEREAAGALRQRSKPLEAESFDSIRERADIDGVTAAMREAGGGTGGLATAIGAEWSHPLLMSVESGDGPDLVRRLYMEIYLGSYHFSRMAKESALFYRSSGLIENELLAIPLGHLERLHGRYRRRIALLTERPREMALYSLQRLRIDRLFDTVLTEEDVVGEEARLRRLGESDRLNLPNPFLVVEAARTLDGEGNRPAAAVGSLPDMIVAARRAAQQVDRPLESWGVVPALVGKERVRAALEESGAERLFDSPEAFAGALLSEKE